MLIGEEVKDFVVINFSEYFKSTQEKLYSKLNKTQNFRKVAKSLYISLKHLMEYTQVLLIIVYISIMLRF